MTTKKVRAGFYADRKAPLTQELLKSVLDYNPETGLFTRKTTWHRYLAGTIAGCLNPNGYVYMYVNGTRIVAQRLAWLYMTGELPALDIDHMNGIKSDNRWVNLREASESMNLQNQHRAHRNNESGLLGVRRNSENSWTARIRVDGKYKHIGSFSDPNIAHAAYLEAKRKYHDGWCEMSAAQTEKPKPFPEKYPYTRIESAPQTEQA